MQIFRIAYFGRLTSYSQLHSIYNLVITSINTGLLKDHETPRCGKSAALLRESFF